MLQYERIDVSEGTDLNKTCTSEECVLCHYSHFGFKFEEHVCNRCHDLLTMAYSLENIAILKSKGTTFTIILWRNEGLRTIKNSILKDEGVL